MAPPQGGTDDGGEEEEQRGVSSSSSSGSKAPAMNGGSGGSEVPVRVVHHRAGKGLDAEGEAEAEAEAELRATIEMAHYCFEVLLHHFRGGAPPVPAFDTAVECPLFVTWEKEQPPSHRHPSSSRRDHHLRGCIGTLSPRPLDALRDYVHSSAFRDRRFPPIAEPEVPSLRCSVSLLVRYEEAEHAFDWEVGVHGIIIAFKCPNGSGRRYSATYLPEVAREQRWNQREALESLVRKAGYTGKLTEAFWGLVSLTRYQSSKATLTYADFLARASATSADGADGMVDISGDGGKGKGKGSGGRRIHIG